MVKTTAFFQMYNVKQTQSEIHELKEKLSIQQQKNQLNELSNEREGKALMMVMVMVVMVVMVMVMMAIVPVS